MTRAALAHHLWQFRWQYTYSFLRVWRGWQLRGVKEIAPWTQVAERRLALCELFLAQARQARWSPRHWLRAARAALDYLRWDYEHKPLDLQTYRAHLRQFAG